MPYDSRTVDKRRTYRQYDTESPMHTSKVLQASDFQFIQRATDTGADSTLSQLYPDYQISDRIGVVSPQIADGLLYTSYALLGLTTMFYDRLRANSTQFFDYPQHFAF